MKFKRHMHDVDEVHKTRMSTDTDANCACIDQLLQEELKKSQQEKELVQQRARLYLADEQLLQSVTSVQQLANMETELEQALERVRARKVSH